MDPFRHRIVEHGGELLGQAFTMKCLERSRKTLVTERPLLESGVEVCNGFGNGLGLICGNHETQTVPPY
jgi:hypothetical protein